MEPLSVANAALQLQRQVDLATHASLTETVLDVLARIRAVHRDSGPLMLATARLARSAGRFQEALDIALTYEREYPDMLAALAAANAYRSMGDVPAALTAYHRALAREPGNLPVWNDIGDMRWEHEREAEALEAYEKVLAHQPAHPWALPSALLLRAQVKKDVTLLREFQRYAQAHPENPRANELHRRLMAPGATPPPSNWRG